VSRWLCSRMMMTGWPGLRFRPVKQGSAAVISQAASRRAKEIQTRLPVLVVTGGEQQPVFRMFPVVVATVCGVYVTAGRDQGSVQKQDLPAFLPYPGQDTVQARVHAGRTGRHHCRYINHMFADRVHSCLLNEYRAIGGIRDPVLPALLHIRALGSSGAGRCAGRRASVVGITAPRRAGNGGR
jgi:hypothetical protein